MPKTSSPHFDDLQERKRIDKHTAVMGKLDVARYRARAQKCKMQNTTMHHNTAVETSVPSTPMFPFSNNDQSYQYRRRSTVDPSAVLASLEEIGAMNGSLAKKQIDYTIRQITSRKPANADTSMNQNQNCSERAVRGSDNRRTYGEAPSRQQTTFVDSSADFIPPIGPGSLQSIGGSGSFGGSGYTTSTDGSPWSEVALTVGSRSLLSQAGQSLSTTGGPITRYADNLVAQKRMMRDFDGPGRVEFENNDDEEEEQDEEIVEQAGGSEVFSRRVNTFFNQPSSMHCMPSETPISVVATPVYNCGRSEQ
eukprot:3136288-Ditylum_brightwellii.AAC.1